MNHILVSNRHWNDGMAARISHATGHTFHHLNTREDLTVEILELVQPRYVFFTHWSYIIPKEIHQNFECIIFHMTDVPFGRGGSPLQNLIARKIYETKITALRCEAELDAGPVYMKRSLSLYGGAEEIYLRAAKTIETMISEIVQNAPEPVPQHGKVVTFQRRKPKDSDIAELTDLDQVFDFIRMLDADGYPKAFLETENLKLEFQRPMLKFGKIVADVTITKKG